MLTATTHFPNEFYNDMQGMAGNIIHAIATTNAIVGGLIVVEALKVLAGQPDKCKVRRLVPCLITHIHAHTLKRQPGGNSACVAHLLKSAWACACIERL